jgi:hypothetical protein
MILFNFTLKLSTMSWRDAASNIDLSVTYVQCVREIYLHACPKLQGAKQSKERVHCTYSTILGTTNCMRDLLVRYKGLFYMRLDRYSCRITWRNVHPAAGQHMMIRTIASCRRKCGRPVIRSSPVRHDLVLQVRSLHLRIHVPDDHLSLHLIIYIYIYIKDLFGTAQLH